MVGTSWESGCLRFITKLDECSMDVHADYQKNELLFIQELITTDYNAMFQSFASSTNSLRFVFTFDSFFWLVDGSDLWLAESETNGKSFLVTLHRAKQWLMLIRECLLISLASTQLITQQNKHLLQHHLIMWQNI